ncbi:hypothetical protein BIU97_11835 [Curtobacterium sp. MCBA15_009]|nr:hypothetical protein BIU97_11835 [Curtobacterium sp. MCBA15_009]
MTPRPSRRASRPAGPVTPETDQLVGTWTRADDASAVAPPVRPAPDGGETGEAGERPGGLVRRRRRVTTQPVPGYAPDAPPEPARHRDGENDDQLRRDVPPHW